MFSDLDLNSFPEHIFQYRRFNEHTESNFEKSLLFLSHPNEVNDPFEFMAILTPDLDNIEAIHDMLARKGKNVSLTKLKKQLQDPENIKKWERDNIYLLKEYRNDNDFGISCFTPKFNNKLMWAHYAESHKGFCCKFNFKELSIDLAYNAILASKVKYQENDFLPKIFLPPKQEDVERMLARKGIDWAYEEEIRFVKGKNSNLLSIGENDIETIIEKNGEQKTVGFTAKIPKKSLSAIYFGKNCSNEHIEKIEQAIKKANYPKVKFYKMELNFDKGKYEMKEEHLSTFIGKK